MASQKTRWANLFRGLPSSCLWVSRAKCPFPFVATFLEWISNTILIVASARPSSVCSVIGLSHVEDLVAQVFLADSSCLVVSGAVTGNCT